MYLPYDVVNLTDVPVGRAGTFVSYNKARLRIIRDYVPVPVGNCSFVSTLLSKDVVQSLQQQSMGCQKATREMRTGERVHMTFGRCAHWHVKVFQQDNR